ncbi:acylneuraminate cytidylyltransferase family protein [Phocaeicola coprophilus]|uniref:acylneuraminate cytidylyltransferase family protein n=1 Tax=Phocaeicola coprophilus TaxID=387090 RepID=UPI0026721A77|nr:acylneuraminate cytidylyltransferase family protein [Phocaeicola coprophilus]
MENILVVIPARGGSKGVPKKNIKLLNGKPLIYYSIDVARNITKDENICVTTDDDEIIECVKEYNLKVPFKRPKELATDHAGTNEVILHALDFYEKQGKIITCIVLLQPTSPFRKPEFIQEAISLYEPNIDMVVSVKETASNPYYNCFEENKDGYLYISKGDGTIERRQDAPKVYEFNGSIYIINPQSLKKKGLAHFTKIKKYEMDNLYSIDIDTMFDWKIAELTIKEHLI